MVVTWSEDAGQILKGREKAAEKSGSWLMLIPDMDRVCVVGDESFLLYQVASDASAEALSVVDASAEALSVVSATMENCERDLKEPIGWPVCSRDIYKRILRTRWCKTIYGTCDGSRKSWGKGMFSSTLGRKLRLAAKYGEVCTRDGDEHAGSFDDSRWWDRRGGSTRRRYTCFLYQPRIKGYARRQMSTKRRRRACKSTYPFALKHREVLLLVSAMLIMISIQGSMTFEAMGFVKPVDIDARWDEGGVFSRTFSLRRAYGVDGPNFGAIVSRSLHFMYIWCVLFLFQACRSLFKKKKKGVRTTQRVGRRSSARMRPAESALRATCVWTFSETCVVRGVVINSHFWFWL